jgi:transcriptional regulator with XRE-family HTH domain
VKTIRELREAQDWSQADLAAKIDVSPSTVYNWESNRSEPKLSQFKALSILFGVSMDAIEIPDTKKPLAA